MCSKHVRVQVYIRYIHIIIHALLRFVARENIYVSFPHISKANICTKKQ
jgi:hypothetical protein